MLLRKCMQVWMQLGGLASGATVWATVCALQLPHFVLWLWHHRFSLEPSPHAQVLG